MEKFETNELPYEQLQLIGLNKKDVFNMHPDDLSNMLSGGRTQLQNLSFDNEGKKIEIQGKLSLQREKDNSVSLLLHPIRQEIENNIGLTGNEIEKLKAGKLINKNIDGERYLVQLDRETNEILKAKTKDINIPIQIKGPQRDRLLEGRGVKINSPSGEVDLRLDLIDTKGYKLSREGEQEQKNTLNHQNKKNEKNNIKLIILATLLISPTIGIYFLAKELLDKEKQKLDLSDKDIQRLLEGKKTGVKDFNQIEQDLKGKLGFQYDKNGNINLVIHPVQNEIKNDIGLTNQEVEKLKAGELINKNIDGEKHLIQLDRETNEILKANINNIPTHIKDVKITPEQKTSLTEGKTIELTTRAGEPVQTKIDLSVMGGIAINDDREKLIKIASGGIKEIDNLFPDKEQRNLFVERTGMKELYNNYQDFEVRWNEALRADNNSTMRSISESQKEIEANIRTLADSKAYHLEPWNINIKENQALLNNFGELERDIQTVNNFIKEEQKYVGSYRIEKETEISGIFTKYGNSSEIEKFGDMLQKHNTTTLIDLGIADKLQEQPYVKNYLSNFDNINSPLHAVLGNVELKNLSAYKEELKDDSLGLRGEIEVDRSLTNKQIENMKGSDIKLQEKISEVEKREINLDNLLNEFYNKSSKQRTESENRLMTQMSSSEDLNLSSADTGKAIDLENKLWEKEKAIEYDLVTPGVSDVIQTDENRAEKMDLEHSQKDIQREGNANEEKISSGLKR